MSYCIYCDEPLRNDWRKMGYAERVRSITRPWKYVHKVPEYGLGSNLVATWPTVHYKREACNK